MNECGGGDISDISCYQLPEYPVGLRCTAIAEGCSANASVARSLSEFEERFGKLLKTQDRPPQTGLNADGHNLQRFMYIESST
jgi:hypothetical protein